MKVSKYCLGTVQFGLKYGVTNHAGQVDEDEVRRILHLAKSSCIDIVDTAQAYGTSETVLGNCWPYSDPLHVVSKLPAGLRPESWESSFFASLERLKVKRLEGFLLHRASDLLSQDGQKLINWLESLQSRGLVNRVGVSIYEASDLVDLPLNRLQIVQLPLSLYDQRLLKNGTIQMLSNRGISVYARSIFLQGLLLKDSAEWPSCLSKSLRQHHSKCSSVLLDNGISPLEAALGFVRQCHGVDTIVFGVLTAEELNDFLAASRCIIPPNIYAQMCQWQWSDKRDIDPREW